MRRYVGSLTLRRKVSNNHCLFSGGFDEAATQGLDGVIQDNPLNALLCQVACTVFSWG